jgi:large subunit ribosomal protein L20
MTRVKRGVAASKRRKKVLKMAKGFRWRRKSHYQAAKEALLKAGKYAYRDRRNKKRTNRSLWIIRINNAVRPLGITYKDLIKKMKDKKIEIDRKVLSQMAVSNPDIFKKLISELQK